MVSIGEEKIKDKGIEILEGDFVKITNGLVRHNEEKLSSVLIETIMEKKLLYDKKKIIEYFYLSERLKEKKKNREQ
jgi:dihydroxyacetone kinase-like predicted kinase